MDRTDHIGAARRRDRGHRAPQREEIPMTKRTPKRRFEASEQTIYRDLRATIIKMSVASLATPGDTAVSPEVAILQHRQK